jgi:F-type H+-transporting ATPase subunit c
MELTALAASIAVLTGIGAAIGVSICCGKGVEAIARQPEKEGSIRALSFLGMVLCEACAIYGLLISIMLFAQL